MSCKNCGRCCLEMGAKIYATPDDVKRWLEEEREDILRHVLVYTYYDLMEGEKIEGGEVWFDEYGNRLEKCPFIEERDGRVYCRIHETKPEQCKDYRCW